MKSSQRSVQGYLDELPLDRREALAAVRQVVLQNLPDGYQEVMNWGMISYEVPLSVYPDTYNKQPLMYAALGNQKNYMAIYLCNVNGSDALRQEFETAYAASGKKLDMGKSCVRFKQLDDLPLDVIAKTVAATQVNEFTDYYEKAMAAREQARDKSKQANK